MERTPRLRELYYMFSPGGKIGDDLKTVVPENPL